jgi:hypothetical protein
MAPVIINWSFSCGHQFTKKIITNNPSRETKTSSLQCPECTEMENQTRSLAREKEELKKKKEDAARDQEKNALALYQAQAAFIAKQIEDDGGDPQFGTECQRMLENCKVLWAGKAKTAGTKVENKPPQLPSSSCLIELWDSKIKSADAKMTLLSDTSLLLQSRELALQGSRSRMWE